MERRQVTETFEAGSIVVVNEAKEKGISFGVGWEESVSDAALGLAADGFDYATVEAFDETIGLRAEGSCKAVTYPALGADAVEGMPTGRAVVGFVLHVDSEAIGELAVIVGQNGVHGMREMGEKALEERCRGIGIAFGVDLQIDIAGGAIDCDEGVALALLQGGQVLEIDVDEADGCLLEDADQGFVGLRSLIEAVAHQTAMDSAAGELAIDAAAHHLGDVIKRQPKSGAQLANQRLLQGGETDRQLLRSMRTIRDRRAAAPAANGRLAHSELAGKHRHRRLAALNVSSKIGRAHV